MDKVTILMATYNGSKYLEEQLNSIIKQDYTNWKLIVSDDHSTDETIEILQKYEQQYPDKIELLLNKTASGSAKRNFFKLIDKVDADYIMFCDQDDIWEPKKISYTLKYMKAKEEKETPILIHTDLTVVDEDMNVISASFMKHQHLRPSNSLHDIVIQNSITGCTMMINRALLNLLKRKVNIDFIEMHDWWCGLIAAAFGKIYYIKKSTIKYRQHANNSVGAQKYGLRLFFRKKFQFYKKLKSTFIQAGEFLRIFGKDLTPNDYNLLFHYSECVHLNKIQRIWVYIRFQTFKQGIGRKICQLIFC